MADIDTVVRWRGRTVVDQSGDKIGKFEEIYLDADSERPEWASVTTGLFGLRQTLFPLRGAQEEGDDLRVPFDKDHVKDAPNVDPNEQLSHEEETVLYRHYGISHGEGEAREEATRTGAGESPRAAAADTSADEAAERRSQPAPAAAPGPEASPQSAPRGQAAGPASGAERAGPDQPAEAEEPTPEPAQDRSAGREQEIPLETEVGPRQRVRLKKYVVTDEVTKTVPVEREEVRVEREPFAGGDREDAQSSERRPGGDG